MDDSTKAKIESQIQGIDKNATGLSQDSLQAPYIAQLHVILAEEQAKSAAKLERFTFWLVCLTGALIFIGVVQIILMFCGH